MQAVPRLQKTPRPMPHVAGGIRPQVAEEGRWESSTSRSSDDLLKNSTADSLCTTCRCFHPQAGDFKPEINEQKDWEDIRSSSRAMSCWRTQPKQGSKSWIFYYMIMEMLPYASRRVQTAEQRGGGVRGEQHQQRCDGLLQKLQDVRFRV